MYYGCTKAGFRDDLEPWCSTKVNPINNFHVIGAQYFGNCTKSDNCPVQKEALTKLDILQAIFHPSKYLILVPVGRVWVVDVGSHARTCEHICMCAMCMENAFKNTYTMCMRVALFWPCDVWSHFCTLFVAKMNWFI